MGRQSNEAGRRRAAALVERAMAARGLNQTQLRAVTGLAKGTVSTFLQGDTWPNDKTLHAIESALGLPRDALQAAHDGSPPDEPSQLSERRDTFESADGAGLHVVSVKAAAIGVELSSTYTDAEDRPRALDTITKALVELMRGNGEQGAASGDAKD